MRKISTVLIGIASAAALLFGVTACKELFADIEEDFSYWASEGFVKDHSIDSPHKPDRAGVQCVPSATDATVTLSMHNPKGLSLVMPTASAPADIVEFKGLPVQPAAGGDYELEQTGSGTLRLTYKPPLLEKYEQGSRGLNPTITLKSKDGRVFKKTYTFDIKSNAAPPKPEKIVIAKTRGSDSRYVLCLEFNSAEMERKVTIDSGTVPVPVHKDISTITISGSSYSLLYKGDNSGFKKPDEMPQIGSFIESGTVEKLTPSSPDVPSGKWVLYFKTDVKVASTNPQLSYTILLHDAAGVVSDSITAELKEKFEVRFDAKGGSPVPATQYIENGGKVTDPSASVSNTGFNLNGWYTDEAYTHKWDFTSHTVTGNMTLYAKWTKKTYTVTFSVAGGQGELQGTYGGQSQITQNGSSAATLTNVPHDESVSFTATLTDTNQYKVGAWTCTPSEGFTGPSGSSTASLTVTADTTVTVQFVQLNALTPTELKIHGQNALGGSVTLPYTVSQVAKSDISLAFSGYSSIPFTIEPSGGITLTPGGTKILTMKVAASPGNYLAWSKTVSITRSKNSVANLTSFKLNGETKTAPFASEYTVESTTAKVTGWTFDTNSDGATASVSPTGTESIPIGSGKSFTITVKAQDGTQSTVTFTVKRKKYNVSYSVAGGAGKIKAGFGSPVTNGSVQVEYDGSVTFTAEPDTGWVVKQWTLGGSSVNGTNTTYTLSNVTAPKTVAVQFTDTADLQGGGNDAWKRLKEEAKKPAGAKNIIINSEIEATDDNGNNGEITLGRNLTIKGTGSSAVLNANNRSRIFKVENDKTLTLEHITLKNGKESGGKGGGVYIDGGTLVMEDGSVITGCSAGKGGGVYVNGIFDMSGSAQVDENNDVYLESGKVIRVNGVLSKTPSARITPDSYTDGRVLVKGSDADKVDFTVTPEGGNKYWRYKKVGDEIKFVSATLNVLFKEIKCVRVDDGPGRTAEYYWTMKVNGQMISERKDGNGHTWDAAAGDTLSINKNAQRSFSYFPVGEIPVRIDIYEDDGGSGGIVGSGDDYMGTTMANLTYDYDNDRWTWTYDSGAWEKHGNQLKNHNVTISDDGVTKRFTEEYRGNDGDTDVTLEISWR